MWASGFEGSSAILWFHASMASGKSSVIQVPYLVCRHVTKLIKAERLTRVEVRDAEVEEALIEHPQ